MSQDPSFDPYARPAQFTPQGGTPHPYPEQGWVTYGPPQQPGYGPYGPVRQTNTLAILALVLAFVFAPAGIVLGVMARKQIRRTGEDGDGLALAGMIVGVVFTALIVIYVIFLIALFGIALSQAPATF